MVFLRFQENFPLVNDEQKTAKVTHSHLGIIVELSQKKEERKKQPEKEKEEKSEKSRRENEEKTRSEKTEPVKRKLSNRIFDKFTKFGLGENPFSSKKETNLITKSEVFE